MPTMSAQPDGVSNAEEEELPATSAVAGTAPAATWGFPISACVAACIPQYTGANTSWSGFVTHPLLHTQLQAPFDVASVPWTHVQLTPAARLQAPPAPHAAAAGGSIEALDTGTDAAAGASGGDGGGAAWRTTEKRDSESVTCAREAPSPAQCTAWLAAPPPGAGDAEAAATKLQASPRAVLSTEASVVPRKEQSWSRCRGPPAGTAVHAPSDAAHGLHSDHDCGETHSMLAPSPTCAVGTSTPSSVALAATRK